MDEELCGCRMVGHQGSRCDGHNLDVSGSPNDGNRGRRSAGPLFRSHCGTLLMPRMIGAPTSSWETQGNVRLLGAVKMMVADCMVLTRCVRTENSVGHHQEVSV